MSKKLILAEALSLSPAERIQLVEDIWDSIAEVPEAVVLTDAQRRELDARLERHRKDPSATIPWEEIKASLLRKA